MNPRISGWLKQHITKRTAGCWIGAFLALVGGLFVLFLTFWFAYAILWFVDHGVSSISQGLLGRRIAIGHNWRLMVCACFVMALFVERLIRKTSDSGDYGPVRATQVMHTGAFGAVLGLLANPHASSMMITELLYTGPRLVIGSAQLLRYASSLSKLDQPSCAWVLEVLAARNKAATFEELQAAWPDANWENVLSDLAKIPGIVRLEKGLSMTSDLRHELGQPK